MKIISKIKFDNTFYIFLLLILLSGLFKEFTFIFILLFCHEMGHAIVGIGLMWKVKQITFYPYGGLTLFEERENRSINKEIIIILAGPLVQTITYLVLSYFFKYDYIKNYHLTILIFNFLPILTLDGGRLVNLILDKFFNYLKSFYITFVISIITLVILILFCIINYHNFNLFLMSIFLGFKIIKGLKDIKYYYRKFLLERYLYDFNYKKISVSKNIYNLYKERNHYIEFQDEKSFLNKFFKNNN